MTTIYWVGGADAVAQVHTASIDSVDGTPADNTFKVTMGAVAISAVGDTDVATTATALRAALNASTHPNFAAVTWSGTAGDIIGTADVLGVEFAAELTETGSGSGAVTVFAVSTANAGPHSASTAANYSGGALPVSADTLVFRDSAVAVAYDLDALTAVDLALLRIEKTYTGKIGLLSTKIATGLDGTTLDATIATAAPLPSVTPEYRDTYLQIGWDRAEIGQHFGPGSPSGSARLKLHNTKAGASDTIIFDTHSSGEANKPSVMFLAANAGADFWIRKCPGDIGFAADRAGETATIGDVSITAPSSTDAVYIESGTTLTSVTQSGGTCYLKSAATVTTASLSGGTLNAESDQTITTVTVDGGTANLNNVPAAGSAVTTLNINAGTVSLQQSDRPRTIGTVNPSGGSLLDNDVVTVTTMNRPAGRINHQWSAG